VAAKYPTVKFIGHAQTWWGNIDRLHRQEELYPAGPVASGGITDLLLSDFPNVYADLSAASGLKALARDRNHAREFIARHRDKLLFGTDCEYKDLDGPTCWCGLTLQLLWMLDEPSTGILPKILHGNAQRILKLNLPGSTSEGSLRPARVGPVDLKRDEGWRG
jgi:predicted TIM-barrel fold metal-dependent hydrolase